MVCWSVLATSTTLSDMVVTDPYLSSLKIVDEVSFRYTSSSTCKGDDGCYCCYCSTACLFCTGTSGTSNSLVSLFFPVDEEAYLLDLLMLRLESFSSASTAKTVPSASISIGSSTYIGYTGSPFKFFAVIFLAVHLWSLRLLDRIFL